MRRCRPPRTVARCGTRPGASSPSERCRSRSGTESGTAIKQAALVRNAAAAGTTPTDLARGGSLKCTLLNGARDRADDHGRSGPAFCAVSYTHLRAHETVLDLVCRLLLEKKKKK